MARLANFFETLTFNIIMSIVALAMPAKNLIAMVAAGSFAPGGLLFIVWIVIVYQVGSASIAALKERLQWRYPWLLSMRGLTKTNRNYT